MKFGIGQPAARVEDRQLLVGAGCFSDDVPPGQGLRIAFLRAPHAHARMRIPDVSAARKLAGVQLVATQADLDADKIGDIECQFCPPLIGGGKMQLVSKPAMVRDIIRHAGDIIAMVVAATVTVHLILVLAPILARLLLLVVPTHLPVVVPVVLV